MRRIVAALATGVAVAVLAGFAPPAHAAAVTYTEPVAGQVIDPFRPPATPYGRGNRGLTYRTEPGSSVRAAAPGRVTFAGQVGGAKHVVVEHADGVRTSYSFLDSVRVRAGQVVDRGDVLGTTGNEFHFGARIGDAYIDPAILLASGPARVHLVPDGEFAEAGASNDRQSLLSVIADRIAAVPGAAVDWAKSGADAAGDVAEAVARYAASKGIPILDAIVDLGELAGPMAGLAAALADIAQRFVDPCTPPDVQPPPPSKRRIAVFVAGLGSQSKGQHQHGNLSERMHADALGYADGDTYDFSYRGGRNPQPYEPRDTVRDLRDDARDLRDLLDRIAVENPGVPVDLIAHSQGGLIAREALAHDYDGPGHQLPDVEHFVTLGTPHHGADAATTLAWMQWTPQGQQILRVARALHTEFDLAGPGLAQLSEDSAFIRTMNRRGLREGVAYTSVGGANDIIVPAVRARLRGAANTLIDVGGPLQTHTSLPDSAAGQREAALAIADMPPTCQSIATVAFRAFSGVAIAEAEDRVGDLVAAHP